MLYALNSECIRRPGEYDGKLFSDSGPPRIHSLRMVAVCRPHDNPQSFTLMLFPRELLEHVVGLLLRLQLHTVFRVEELISGFKAWGLVLLEFRA